MKTEMQSPTEEQDQVDLLLPDGNKKFEVTNQSALAGQAYEGFAKEATEYCLSLLKNLAQSSKVKFLAMLNFLGGSGDMTVKKLDKILATLEVKADGQIVAKLMQVVPKKTVMAKVLEAQKSAALDKLTRIIGQRIVSPGHIELAKKLVANRTYLDLEAIEQEDSKKDVTELLQSIRKCPEYRLYIEGENQKENLGADLKFLLDKFFYGEPDVRSEQVLKAVEKMLSTYRKNVGKLLRRHERARLAKEECNRLAEVILEHENYQDYCNRQGSSLHLARQQFYHFLLDVLKDVPERFKILKEFEREPDYDMVRVILDEPTAIRLDQKIRDSELAFNYWKQFHGYKDINILNMSEIQEFKDEVDQDRLSENLRTQRWLEDKKPGLVFENNFNFLVTYTQFLEVCPSYFKWLNVNGQDPVRARWNYSKLLRQHFHKCGASRSGNEIIRKLLEEQDFVALESSPDMGSVQRVSQLRQTLQNSETYKVYRSTNYFTEPLQEKAERELIKISASSPAIVPKYAVIKKLAEAVIENLNLDVLGSEVHRQEELRKLLVTKAETTKELASFNQLCRNVGFDFHNEESAFRVQLRRVLGFNEPTCKISFAEYKAVEDKLLANPSDLKPLYLLEVSDKQRAGIISRFNRDKTVQGYCEKVKKRNHHLCFGQIRKILNDIGEAEGLYDKNCQVLSEAVTRFCTIDPVSLKGVKIGSKDLGQMIAEPKFSKVYNKLVATEQYAKFYKMYPAVCATRKASALKAFRATFDHVFGNKISKKDTLDRLFAYLEYHAYDLQSFSRPEVDDIIDMDLAAEYANKLMSMEEYKNFRDTQEAMRVRKGLLAKLNFADFVSNLIDSKNLGPESKVEVSKALETFDVKGILSLRKICQDDKIDIISCIFKGTAGTNPLLNLVETLQQEGAIGEITPFIDFSLQYLQSNGVDVDRRPYERYLRSETDIDIRGLGILKFKRTSTLKDLEKEVAGTFGNSVKFQHEGSVVGNNDFEKLKYQPSLRLNPVKPLTVQIDGGSQELSVEFGQPIISELKKKNSKFSIAQGLSFSTAEGAKVDSAKTVEATTPTRLNVSRVKVVDVMGQRREFQINTPVRDILGLIGNNRAPKSVKHNGVDASNKLLKDLDGHNIRLDYEFEGPEDDFYSVMSRENVEKYKANHELFRQLMANPDAAKKAKAVPQLFTNYAVEVDRRYNQLWNDLITFLDKSEISIIARVRKATLLHVVLQKLKETKNLDRIMQIPDLVDPVKKKLITDLKTEAKVQEVESFDQEVASKKQFMNQ